MYLNMSNVNELTNADFESKIEKSTGYALIDFWAPWCGPCRMMSPIIDEISNEVKNVSFYKVNVDEEQELATRFRVSGIPFFALFKDGKVIASRTGGASKEDFVDWLKEQTK